MREQYTRSVCAISVLVCCLCILAVSICLYRHTHMLCTSTSLSIHSDQSKVLPDHTQ